MPVPTLQERKRRQRILRASGHKEVPEDGSWGPYQSNLWDQYVKLTPWYGKALDKVVATVNSVEPVKRLFDIVGEANDKVRESSIPMIPANLVNSGFRLVTAPVSVGFSYMPDKVQEAMSYLDPTRITNLFNPRLYTDPDFRYNMDRTGPQWMQDAIETVSWLTPVKYAKDVQTRRGIVNEGNTAWKGYHATQENLAKQVDRGRVLQTDKNIYLDAEIWDKFPDDPNVSGGIIKLHDPKTVNENPGLTTIELHQMPRIVYDDQGHYVSHYPNDFSIARSARKMTSLIEDGSAMATERNAQSLGQYIFGLPEPQQRKFIWTGMYEKPELQPVNLGFSTDVILELLNSEKKGRGYIVPSVNSYMTNLGTIGNKASEFGKYFGEQILDVESGLPIWLFEDMTPSQVRMWNRDFPKFKIDLQKRRMTTPIFMRK